MSGPTLSPARWWRDDATRYQARPLIGVCRTFESQEIELLRPSPMLDELVRYLDDVARWHSEHQACVCVARDGSPMSADPSSALPPAGFYWAKVYGGPRWTIVEVSEFANVYIAGVAGTVEVTEWGPGIPPPDVCGPAIP